MPQNMPDTESEQWESLEAELHHFQQEKEKIRAIVGQIGSTRSSKPEHVLTLVFAAAVLLLFLVDLLAHILHVAIPFPPLFSLTLGVFLVSLKMIWMMHKQGKSEHFQFWMLSSIEFRLNDVAKKMHTIEKLVKHQQQLYAGTFLTSGHSHDHDLQIWTVEEPPGNFIDDDGLVSGLAVEFVQEIQRRLGNTAPIRMMPWAQLDQTALERPNIVCFSVARTPEREDRFHWISLLMRKPWAFYARKDADIHMLSLEEAKQVAAIGVMRGDARAAWLAGQGFSNLVKATRHTQNVQRLVSGNVPLLFYSPEGMSHTCRELGYDIHDFELVLAVEPSLSYIAISKKGSDQALVAQWQESAQQLKEDGTFAQLAEKWGHYSFEHDGIISEVKEGALNFWRESR